MAAQLADMWAEVTRTYNKGTPAERFRLRLRPMDNGCIEYQGYRDGSGYGRFGLTPSVNMLAHRFAWLLQNGPVPFGLSVLHHCDNPPCCNTEHLFVGTLADNNADMRNKGRAAPIPHGKGENHPGAKLTDAAVAAIRREYAPRRVTRKSLAARFGVSEPTICAVLSRRNWSHIP